MTSIERIGRYEVLGRIATGGMAEILLGVLRGPSGFERPCVIKRILPHLSAEPSFESMFLDEARIVARISHPNVVQVHELGRSGEDLFLVMELLEGESLGSIMRRAHVRRLSIPLHLACHIVAEALNGLHAAHELRAPDGSPLGLVHRDLSPQNVFITYDGSVKLLDFGIAKVASRLTRTETGVIKGSMPYMSPEQALGEDVDRRSDLFSLGTVLYELATGQRLFHRGGAGTLRAVLDAPIPQPRSVRPEISEELDALIARALSRPRDARFQSAAEMRRALLPITRALVTQAHATESPEEQLGALMSSLFASRREEKSALVQSLALGDRPEKLPAPETDVEIELPVATGEARTRTRWWPWAALAALAALLLLGTAGVVRFDGDDPTPAPAPAVAPPQARQEARAIEAPPIARDIEVQIATTPPGASVQIDGAPRGTTPLTLSLARSSEPVHVRVSLVGYEDSEHVLVPTERQRVHLQLARRRRAASARTLPAAASTAPERHYYPFQ